MNSTLLKANIKFNWIPFAAILFMIMIYVSAAIAMFNPEDAASIQAVFSMMPEGMVKAFGFDGLGTNLTTYLASYFYGFILLVFPLIYTIIAANSLVAGHVDKGSMAYLLSTPNTRGKIITTQAAYFILSTTALLGFITSIIVVLCAILWPGHLEIGSFLVLNLVTLLLLIAVGSVSFLSSCIFNDAKYSLAFGAGIPVLFVMLKIISEIGSGVEFFKYMSPYTLLDTNKILNNIPYGLILSLVLLFVAACIFALSAYIFKRKNLNI
ncbi:MAG: ABC transporter permease subunit [Eubacteriales bacterium]